MEIPCGTEEAAEHLRASQRTAKHKDIRFVALASSYGAEVRGKR